MMLSHQDLAEVQRPLAIYRHYGLVSSTALTLIPLPILIRFGLRADPSERSRTMRRSWTALSRQLPRQLAHDHRTIHGLWKLSMPPQVARAISLALIADDLCCRWLQ